MNRFPTLGKRSLCAMLGVVACLMSLDISAQTSPVSQVDFACQDYQSSLTIFPLENDSPGSSTFDLSTFFIITPPNYGSAETHPDGTVSYVWNGSNFGLDVIEYEICNTDGLCANNRIDVFIKGGNSVFAEDDHYVGLPQSTLTGNVLKNDFDIQGDNFTLSLYRTTDFGTFQFNADGSFTYQANVNFTGYDFARYTICDDNAVQMCQSAIVHFYIESVKKNNVKTLMDFKSSFAVVVDNTLTGNVLEDYAGLNISLSDLNCSVINGPTNGAIQVMPNGDFSYVPNVAYVGTDQIDIQVCDETDMTCIETSILIKVIDNPESCNLQPAIVADDLEVGVQGNAISGLLHKNDQNLIPGSFELNQTPVDAPDNGSVTINADGSFSYMPDAGFVGTDQFDYEVTVTDSEPSYTKHIFNQPLDQIIEHFSTNSQLDFSDYGTIYDVNVINLSIDHDNVSQTAIQLTSPSGTSRFLRVSPCNQSAEVFTEIDINFDDEVGSSIFPCPPNDGGVYKSEKPLADFKGEEANGIWTLNVLNYQPNIYDGTINNWGLEITTIEYPPLATRRATASILVMPFAKRPVAVSDCYDVVTGSNTNVNPLENDFDENNDIDPLSVSIIQEPTVGTAMVEPDGTITYRTTMPLTEEEITYELCDTLGQCDIATIKFRSSMVVGLDLLSFQVTNKGRGEVLLDWETANEEGVAYFGIERNEGDGFYEIEQVHANNRIENVYEFDDWVSSLQGSIYYRIKSVDKDGSYTYSEVRGINIDEGHDRVRVGPNPTNATLNLYHTYKEVDQIIIQDVSGQKCYELTSLEIQNKSIDVSHLIAGSYMLTLVTRSEIVNLPFIKI